MKIITQRNFALVYILFAISGFSGLIYEAIWARYLKLFLGHSSYGQILTLCIYMGGLGFGSFIAGKLLHRIKHLLMAYAVTELCIGLGGFVYHPVYVFLTQFLLQSGWLHENYPFAASLLKISTCILITFPMAILLGMTFPFITVGMMRLQENIMKQVIPSMYFSNSIGAAIGILCTSFVFIPLFGTQGSLTMAGILNLGLAITFYCIHMRMNTTKFITSSPTEIPEAIDETKIVKNVSFLILLAFATGFSSFLYEVGWLRLLTLLLGSSTHSFDIMVSAFILGLSGGALYVSKKRFTSDLLVILAWVQILMGCCAVITLFFYKPFFHLVNMVFILFKTPKSSYLFVSVLKYVLCIIMMCPAGFFAGMTLPLITYALCKAAKDEAYTGRVYGWNTIGSIFGAALGGLVILPIFQLEKIICFGALIDILFGIVLLYLVHSVVRHKYISLALSSLVIICTIFFKFDAQLVTSGAFRYLISREKRDVWIRHGKTATISVNKSEDHIAIRTNGKVDASLDLEDKYSGDNITQAGLAFYSMATQIKPYDIAIIGLGSGLTAHYLLADPLVTKVDMIEIEEEMYNLSSHFKPHNERIYSDPRFKIHFQDARTYFASRRKPYTIIMSEPSNPWISGVSSLFTSEFYSQLKPILQKDGILIQWIQLYEFNTELLMSIFKAIAANFNYFRVYSFDDNYDICIIISDSEINFKAFARMKNTPSIQAEFTNFEIPVETFSNRCFLLSRLSLEPIFPYYKANSDFFPVVDNLSEQAFYQKQRVNLFKIFDGDVSFYQEFYELPHYSDIIKNKAIKIMDYNYVPSDNSLQYLFQTIQEDDFEVTDWSKFVDDFIEVFPFEIWPAMVFDKPLFDSLCLFIENNASDKQSKNKLMLHYYLAKNELPKLHEYVTQIISDTPKEWLSYSESKNLFIAALKSKDKKSAHLVYNKFLKHHLTKKPEEQIVIDELLKKFI